MIAQRVPLKRVLTSLRAGVSVNSSEVAERGLGQPSVLKTSSVIGGRFLPEESKPIARRDLARARVNPLAGTIVISRMNTPELVGECGYVPADHPDLYLPDRLWLATARNGVCARWLSYLLSSEDYRRRLRLLATGTSGSMKNISREALLGMEVAMPAVEEQEEIARVLADADELIASLGRVVEKKRAIKEGAMQRLLTGRQRLPGFNSEWATRTVGSLGAFLRGRGIKRDDVRERGVPCVRYGELYTRYEGYTPALVSRVDAAVARTALPIRSGDLLFAGSGETAAEIGTCVAYVGAEPAVAGGDIVLLRPGTEHNAVFLACLMNSARVQGQKARLGQGDAVVHIGPAALGSIEVELPAKREQEAIAAVIADVDAEIDAVRKQLEKARGIGRGMMQALLGGRSRPVSEAVAR